MIRLLLALLPISLPAPAAALPPAAAATHASVIAEEKVIQALAAWLQNYRTGKVNFTSRASVLKESIANKFGVLPKSYLGELTYERELGLLCEQVAKLDTAAAASVLLEVASIGLDQAKYTRDMAPFLVRGIGEKWLATISSDAGKEQLVKAVHGEVKADKARSIALKAAALRALGARKDPAVRQEIENQLAAPDMPVRLAAVEALKLQADEASAEALTRLLEREDNDNVLEATVQALRSCYAKYLLSPAGKNAAKGQQPAGSGKAAPDNPTGKIDDGKPAGDQPVVEPPAAAKPADKTTPPPPDPPASQLPESSRLAVRAAIKALGRASWRADLALVAFLADFRSPETVPALIAVLQRFKDHPEEVQAGKLSGLLLHRAHETLVSFTGALFPADQPDKWRELWAQDKDKIEVTQRRPEAAARPGDTVSALFGIPVQGTRVLFIVDLSGSMDFPMQGHNTTGEIKVTTRLDVAKAELTRAVQGMPENSALNFITYNGEAKAKTWKKDLLLANAKNKGEAQAFIKDMRANGGTNMWAGLAEGLKMKSFVYGDRYETNVDELFIVSDGAPSVGDVIDAMEILRLVTETNRFSKVRVNTIFITSDNERDPRDNSLTPAELMRRMADENGGRFVQLK